MSLSPCVNLMASNGCFKQMSHHSTTSQYGAFSRSERYFTPAVDAHFRGVARQCFHTDIAGGHTVITSRASKFNGQLNAEATQKSSRLTGRVSQPPLPNKNKLLCSQLLRLESMHKPTWIGFVDA